MADRVRGDGVATTGYDPKNRDNAMHVEYMVHETGARWFIPYNNNASTADQLTQCDKVAGNTADGSVAASETVA